MKFFDNQDVELLFKKFKADKDKEGNRILDMRFAIKLTQDNHKYLPTFLRRAYEGVRDNSSCLDTLTFNRDIEDQNVTFYDLPQHRGDEIRFPAQTLTKFELDRVVNDGTVTINLEFSIVTSCNKASGPWALDRFTNLLWAMFGEAQVEMFEGTKKDKTRAKKKRVDKTVH